MNPYFFLDIKLILILKQRLCDQIIPCAFVLNKSTRPGSRIKILPFVSILPSDIFFGVKGMKKISPSFFPAVAVAASSLTSSLKPCFEMLNCKLVGCRPELKERKST